MAKKKKKRKSKILKQFEKEAAHIERQQSRNKSKTNHKRNVIKRNGTGCVHVFFEDLNDTGCHLFEKGSDRTAFKFVDGILKNSKCDVCQRRKGSS